MDSDKPIITSRKKERVFLVLTTVVLLLLFFRLYIVLQRNFTHVEARLKDGTMVNLNAKNMPQNAAALLTKGFYFDDKQDVNLIEQVLARHTNAGKKFDNIGDLNKKQFYINAEEAFNQGGKSFKQRVIVSRTLLGYTGDDSVRFLQEQKSPPTFTAVADIGMDGPAISGRVLNKKVTVPGVLVRLQMLLPQDSTISDEEVDLTKIKKVKQPSFEATYVADDSKQLHLQSLTAFARTDANGSYSFKNLPKGKAFEILPLQPHYQFGKTQGTESLGNDLIFNFYQAPHTLRLLSSRDFSILKREKSFIIRTPTEFNLGFLIIVIGFMAGFFIVHLVLSARFEQADQLILPMIMVLTGLSFLTLLSLQDPLRDRFLARDTLNYLWIGFAAMLCLLFLNMRRFTTDSGFYRMFVFKNNTKAANGWPWILGAIILLILTIRFGTGPEGSGVKVNLFIFQPSEIVKYLAILFLAGFFAVNEKFISEYASWKKRWSFFSFALIAIGATLLMFLLLGDLGPAMVICFTFIILFSFSRGDFMFMAVSNVDIQKCMVISCA
jgi:hypothetical protein